MTRSARDWPWSSYRATVGQSKGQNCLNVKWVLAAFGKRKSVLIERYKKFISEGKGQPSPWALLRNQLYLGGDQFVEKMHSYIDGSKELSEIPSSQRSPEPEELSYYEQTSRDRNSAILRAYRSGGYTMKQIGHHFGIHYSTVSGIIKKHRSKT